MSALWSRLEKEYINCYPALRQEETNLQTGVSSVPTTLVPCAEIFQFAQSVEVDQPLSFIPCLSQTVVVQI